MVVPQSHRPRARTVADRPAADKLGPAGAPPLPPEVSRDRFAAAGEPKEFWAAPEPGHDEFGATGAVEAAVAFVRDQVAPDPPAPLGRR